MNLEPFKRWLRAHPALEGVAYVLHNNLFPFVNFSGTSLRGLSLVESVAYIGSVAARYRTAAERMGRTLFDAEVLEIGPGDNLGVALCLIAWGARSVVCLDRFDCLSQAHHDGAIYRALLDAFQPEERRRAESSCPWSRDPTRPIAGAITYVPGCTLEEAERALGGRLFDCALSNATLEHVRDVAGGVEAMAARLKGDAWMFHEVDFRCHGRFERISPLHFLTVPDRLWWLMGSRLGVPNRLRINTYRDAFAAAGFTIGEEVLEAAGAAVVERAFKSIDPAVRAAGVDDLRPLVVRFLLVRARQQRRGAH